MKQIPPKSGKRVIIHWENSCGKSRTSIGFYAARFTVEDISDDADESEYHEDLEKYYFHEGWYEDGHFSDVVYTINNVKGWSELPEMKVT